MEVSMLSQITIDYTSTRQQQLFFIGLYGQLIDLAWTGGRWDVESLSCEYHQNPLSAFQYTLGDISCDTVATLGALTAFLRPENRVLSWGSLWFQLLKENVFRSVFTLFVNSISMYVDHVGVDPYVLWIVYSIQDYTYARLMNYELTYKAETAG
ncbi:hypothetical protein BDR26DRAFT_1004039 [Obelidium mucronatum]|nr:hypothetical protein BDR26DRAFT_1004039 [Obelidium mucronatum]